MSSAIVFQHPVANQQNTNKDSSMSPDLPLISCTAYLCMHEDDHRSRLSEKDIREGSLEMLQCMHRSTFGSDNEKECFQGIVDYMNNAGNASSHPHGTMQSWFYWAYNPDSEGALH